MQYNAGLGNIYVYPIPNQINPLRLYLWSVAGQFANVGATVQVAPGYVKAMQYCLAKELAMQFPERAHWTPQLEKEANDAFDWLKSLNVMMTDLVCDEAIINTPGGMWNWRTGSYQGRAF
jgi:hypothetical protein